MPAPMPTVGYSEARARWSEVTKRVIEGKTAVTVIKNNKPAFVMVPIGDDAAMAGSPRDRTFLDIADEVTEEYADVLEKLAR